MTSQLETSLDIDAPPERVWALLSDLTKMPRWSPQVRKTIVRGGTTRLGAHTININGRGPLVWPTRSEVVDYVPGKRIAFRIKENWTVWSFTLEPLPGGRTRVTERRDAPDDSSPISKFLVKNVLGGEQNFEEELREGMAQTLARVAQEL